MRPFKPPNFEFQGICIIIYFHSLNKYFSSFFTVDISPVRTNQVRDRATVALTLLGDGGDDEALTATGDAIDSAAGGVSESKGDLGEGPVAASTK